MLHCGNSGLKFIDLIPGILNIMKIVGFTFCFFLDRSFVPVIFSCTTVFSMSCPRELELFTEYVLFNCNRFCRVVLPLISLSFLYFSPGCRTGTFPVEQRSH